MEGNGGISPSDWFRGITISVLASIIGGISKLCIRKSWLLQAQFKNQFSVGRRRMISNEEDANSSSSAAANDDLLANAAADTTPVPNNNSSNINTYQILTEYNLRQSVYEDNIGGYNDRKCHSHLLLCYALRGSGMFGMSVLNPICCVIAMNYASPSILAPFAGLTLVWVILFSPLVNKEHPTNNQIFSCSFIILGEVVVAVFGDHTNDQGVTVNEVVQSYKEIGFILYLSGLMLYLIVMMYLINYSHSYMLRKFAWGSSSGAVTGVQNFLKDSLIVSKAVRADPYHNSLPILFFVLFLSAGLAALIGLLILTGCMKRYDTTYSASSFVGSFVVSTSIMSALHYNTFAELEGIMSYIMYPFGIATSMVGVYFLIGDSSASCEEETVDEYSNERIRVITIDEDNVTPDSSDHTFDYTEVEGEEETNTSNQL